MTGNDNSPKPAGKPWTYWLPPELSQIMRPLLSKFDQGDKKGYRLCWRETELLVPYRVYAAEPAPALESQLSARAQLLLHGLYLRHHDGFVRERRRLC